MKKFLTLFLILALLATFAGCRAAAQAEEILDQKLDAAEDAAKQAVLSAITADPPAAPAPETQDAAAPITEDQAKTIALEHAGVAEQDTSRLTVRQDWDDGRQEYDVEFHVGYIEYEYEIDAASGKILSFDKDN